MKGHFPLVRLAALAGVAVGAYAIARNGGAPHWRTIGPGMEFTTLRGEPYCRHGSSDVAVLRLDPSRVALRVHHFTRQPDHTPLTIVGWQRRTGALAVFNAGQYYPDLSYMGLLVSGGEVISAPPHPGYRAALVASPVDGSRSARVIDLRHEPIDPRQPAWREVAQSFMLFDRTGALRVRRSDQVANRTVVAEDRRGHLLVVTSEGGYTLSDFARWLRAAPLRASHAMAMDGGYEAELCVKSAGFRYASFGRWKTDDDDAAPGARVPLPAIIAVTAR